MSPHSRSGCHRPGERGVAYLMALFVVLVLGLAAVSLWGLYQSELMISDNLQKELTVLYVARAGVEDALYQLQVDGNWAAGFVNKEFPAASGNFYDVTVTGARPLVTLTAVGRAAGMTRTVVAETHVYGTADPYFVQVKSYREQ